MNKAKAYIVIFLVLLSGVACDYLGLNGDESKESREQNAVARVKTSYLYKTELDGLVPEGATIQDSIDITQKYVNNWIRKELLVQEAANNIQIDQSEIERRVSDYRYALISYEYQKLRIEQALNSDVTDNQIVEYYNENLENFMLKQNIVRGKFIKVSNEAPRKSDVRRWIKSNRDVDLESLKSYAFRFANNYSLEDSTWINFDEVIKDSPFSTISNKIQFLRRNRYIEEADSSYLYLFKIDEYKISDEISPLEFVREDIKKIILNKRRVELAKSLENNIYERAKENEDFEIYK